MANSPPYSRHHRVAVSDAMKTLNNFNTATFHSILIPIDAYQSCPDITSLRNKTTSQYQTHQHLTNFNEDSYCGSGLAELCTDVTKLVVYSRVARSKKSRYPKQGINFARNSQFWFSNYPAIYPNLYS